MDSRQWFKQAKFGMMVHWGLYSIIGGEWKGKRNPYVGEWSQNWFSIPREEYRQLAKVFNPIYFNAEEWVQLAKEAGMQYLVFTAKHHEGFAMYDSKVSDYNICKATPFGRDVTAELAEACYKHGIKLGLYYSQEADWDEPNGGGYGKAPVHEFAQSWCNVWDFPDNDKKDFSQCFKDKIKPQVKEILTQYGDLCLIWFDNPWDITPEQSHELYEMVKHYQPGCLVNSRIGNDLYDYESTGDNMVPDSDKGDALYETPATLNDTWGYKAFDQNWKSVDEVIRLKEYINSCGANYLLNVGPDHLGRIPAPSVDILREVGRRCQ